MHTTQDFIDLLQKQIAAEQGLDAPASYYKVAQTLEISETSVLRWKDGKGSMSDAVALKVANRLQMPHAYVVACIHGERERDPEVAGIWSSIAKHFPPARAARNVGKTAGVIGAVLAAAMMAHPEPAQARTECPAEIEANQPLAAVQFIHYAKFALARVGQFLRESVALLRCVTAPSLIPA